MKIIIILGGGIDGKGILDITSRSRVEKGIEIYGKNKGSKIIMSGRYSFMETKPYTISEAESMKKYAIKLGVPSKDIIIEDKSLDTLGNMYFSRIIVDKNKCKDILIVTSDYHMKRSMYAARKVFGEKYSIEYKTSKSRMNIFRRIYIFKMELFFLMLYKIYLHNIPDGDMKQIKEFLFKKHPGYNHLK